MNTAVVVDFIILMDVIVLIKMIFGDDKIDKMGWRCCDLFILFDFVYIFSDLYYYELLLFL